MAFAKTPDQAYTFQVVIQQIEVNCISRNREDAVWIGNDSTPQNSALNTSNLAASNNSININNLELWPAGLLHALFWPMHT